MEPHNPHQPSLRKLIAEKIHSGELLMRPRWHFVLKGALLVAGVAVVLLFILYIISFVLFALRESGLWSVPAFGFSGVLLFLFSLPWVLLSATLVSIALLEILVRRFSFAYRKPFLYSLGGIIVIVFFGSAFVAQEEVHDRVWRFTEKRHIPLIDPLYRGYAVPHMKGVHPLTVATTTKHGFMAMDRGGETLEVIVGSDTRFPAGFNFVLGDEVVVIGARVVPEDTDDLDTIEALGVKPTRHMNKRPARPWPPFMLMR